MSVNCEDCDTDCPTRCEACGRPAEGRALRRRVTWRTRLFCSPGCASEFEGMSTGRSAPRPAGAAE